MKKMMNLWLMAALVCGLSLSVTSCKDDDDDDELSAEEQAEKEASEQAEASAKFWNVVGQIVGTDQATDDYQNKTFAAIIGDASETNTTVREVLVNDQAAAAARYNDLVGLTGSDAIDETTASHSWQDDAVGTLTYTRSSGDASLATVDVSIRQVPGLRQIVYMTPDQKGKNGGLFDFAFGGVCYYRFGDVISKPNADGKTDYWVCVRPAFGPEGKKDSHWITLSPLPQKNIKHLTLSSHDYYVPTNLSKSTTHMQNLAEMLYALCNPEKWQDNLAENPKVPIFDDFSHSRVKYHNKYFWQMVAQAWQANSVTEKLFGLSANDMNRLVREDDLYFLAEGYSNIWPSKSVTLYQYRYRNGNDKEANMHHVEYSKPSKNVTNPVIEMDFRASNAQTTPGWTSKAFFGDDAPRFTVRFASGKELMGSQPSQFQTMDGVSGISDVYVYNKYYNRTYGKDADVEQEVLNTVPTNDPAKWDRTAYKGGSHYKVGYIYKDEEGNRWICIGQSGLASEESPYAEFVSFEGLTASADKRCITNLPDRDQAIRAAFWLNMIFFQSSDLSDKDQLSAWNRKGETYAHIVLNSRQYADFDPSTLFQRISAQSNDPRQDTHAASIAYNDGSGRQHLLRWIMNNQNAKNDLTWYLSANHVDKPDPNEQKYGEEAFGTTPIYLDDLTSADMIGLFATDTYAAQPLSNGDAKNNLGPTTARNYRTTTDKDATDATKYFYSMAKWSDRTFKTDMWNEPILMFRYTRTLDRGEDEYSTRTTDGHYLTLYKEFRWLKASEMEGSPEEQAEDEALNYESFVASTLGLQVLNMTSADTWHLNGKDFTFPRWNTIKD